MRPSQPDRCHVRWRLQRRTAAINTGGPFTNHQLQHVSGSSWARWAPEDVGGWLECVKWRWLWCAGHRQWSTTDETAPARGWCGATAPACGAATAQVLQNLFICWRWCPTANQWLESMASFEFLHECASKVKMEGSGSVKDFVLRTWGSNALFS
jgi:hypothetical protein